MYFNYHNCDKLFQFIFISLKTAIMNSSYNSEPVCRIYAQWFFLPVTKTIVVY